MRVDDEALKRKDDDGGGGGGGGGGGSLNTYKELCSIVTDIGQPDLIYKFMDLANYQAMLNSSRRAFGFVHRQARRRRRTSPSSCRSSTACSTARPEDAGGGQGHLAGDRPKAAVDAHFAAVMEDLLTECGSRTWRSRQSAASALAELLSGRRFAEMEPFLERVWTASLRSVDDIKETVREAGKALCRSTRGLTVRLCDAHHSKPAETQRTIGVVAPILLHQGLLSPVKEIQGLAMDVLMRVAKHAGSAEIRPFVPEMVKCLLEALSSMEDSRLNYIEQHAPAIGMSAERLEHARLQSSKASPMGETLDVLMGHVDEATMTELVPQLGSVLRSGVGLNTRAGTCRFISRLCLRRGSLVRPHAGKLFKALLAAAAAAPSQSVTSAAVSATAAVARHATEARTHQLVQDVVSMYDSASDDDSGSGDVASSEKRRALASHLALELSRNASDAVAKHAASVLPLAFVGRFDDAESVAKRWQEVWEENAGGASSTLRLYLDEILAACASRLGAAQYRVKRQGAAATAAAAKAAPQVVKPRATELRRGLRAALPGRGGEGKQVGPGAGADVLEAPGAWSARAPGTKWCARERRAGRKRRHREAAIEARAARSPRSRPREDASRDRNRKRRRRERRRLLPGGHALLRELLQPKPDPSRPAGSRRVDGREHRGGDGGGGCSRRGGGQDRRRGRHPRTAVLGDAVRRDARRDPAAPECASLGGRLAPAHGGRARRRARWWPRRRRASPSRHRRRGPARPRCRSVAGAARSAARGCASDARVSRARRRRGRAGGGGGAQGSPVRARA